MMLTEKKEKMLEWRNVVNDLEIKVEQNKVKLQMLEKEKQQLEDLLNELENKICEVKTENKKIKLEMKEKKRVLDMIKSTFESRKQSISDIVSLIALKKELLKELTEKENKLLLEIEKRKRKKKAVSVSSR